MIATFRSQTSITSIRRIDSHLSPPVGVTRIQEEDQATMAVGIPHKRQADSEPVKGSQSYNLALLKTNSLSNKNFAKTSISATTSPTSVIIGKRQRSPRRVHFTPNESPDQSPFSGITMDDNDSTSALSTVSVDVKIDYSRLELTDEERNSMWWQAREYHNFKRKAKQIVRNYRRLGPLDEAESDYVAKFHNAIDICTNSSSHMMDGVPLLSNTQARGLEAHIFPQYHSERRRKVIRSVIKAQSKLPTTIDENGRARLLNATSKHLTRPMRRFARLLAIGDARVVADLDTNVEDLMVLEEPVV